VKIAQTVCMVSQYKRLVHDHGHMDSLNTECLWQAHITLNVHTHTT